MKHNWNADYNYAVGCCAKGANAMNIFLVDQKNGDRYYLFTTDTNKKHELVKALSRPMPVAQILAYKPRSVRRTTKMVEDPIIKLQGRLPGMLKFAAEYYSLYDNTADTPRKRNWNDFHAYQNKPGTEEYDEEIA